MTGSSVVMTDASAVIILMHLCGYVSEERGGCSSRDG
jgi:hypothetical protein